MLLKCEYIGSLNRSFHYIAVRWKPAQRLIVLQINSPLESTELKKAQWMIADGDTIYTLQMAAENLESVVLLWETGFIQAYTDSMSMNFFFDMWTL